MYEYAALKLNLIRDSLKLSTYLYNVLCLYYCVHEDLSLYTRTLAPVRFLSVHMVNVRVRVSVKVRVRMRVRVRITVRVRVGVTVRVRVRMRARVRVMVKG